MRVAAGIQPIKINQSRGCNLLWQRSEPRHQDKKVELVESKPAGWVAPRGEVSGGVGRREGTMLQSCRSFFHLLGVWYIILSKYCHREVPLFMFKENRSQRLEIFLSRQVLNDLSFRRLRNLFRIYCQFSSLFESSRPSLPICSNGHCSAPPSYRYTNWDK